MSSRSRRIVAAAAASLALAAWLGVGCEGGDAEETGSPSTPDVEELRPQMQPESSESTAPSTEGGDTALDGITAEEAKRRGVFVAEFDARLDIVSSTDGDYELVNVGNRADRYQISLDPPLSGTVQPSTLTLEPGETSTIRVEADPDTTVLVHSAGRDEEIAAHPVG